MEHVCRPPVPEGRTGVVTREKKGRRILPGQPETAGERTVYLAEPRGMCAGVRRALDVLDGVSGEVYVLHEIVHNNFIVSRLRKRGVHFVESPDEVPEGATLVFSAHGVSRQVEAQARARHLRVVDATCPLVKRVQASAAAGVAAGELVLLVGHGGHPEVEGILGQAEPGGIRLLERVEDVAALPEADGRPLRLVSQTTLEPEFVEMLRREVTKRYGIVPKQGAGVCYATAQRQNAVRRIAARAELVLIIGSPRSSNSNRLREVAAAVNGNALLLDHPDELVPAQLNRVRTVGVSAGASAPEELITLLLLRLYDAGFHRVETVRDVCTPDFRHSEAGN